MADIVMFHHALGRTAGMEAFAQRLRDAGHDVTLPDLFDGEIFESIDDGVAHAEKMGFGEIMTAAEAVAARLPDRLVYAGFSLGAMPAQKMAQNREGALGALLYHGDVPLTAFGDSWPAFVDIQLHVSENDPWCDLEIMRELVDHASTRTRAELFVYPGSGHLFTDASFHEYDPDSAELVLERSLEFLDRIDAAARS